MPGADRGGERGRRPAAAEAHIDLERLAAVMVGDAAAIAGSLETAGFGPVEIIHDEGEPCGLKPSGHRVPR